MILNTPRLVVAGLSGDAGKTLVAIGLTRALAERGLAVGGFKKGPDYIDAGWLGAACGRPGRNLDNFLLDIEALGEAFRRSGASDVAVIEGNRGLFDGLDARGSCSTAELAKQLATPVVLVIDVTKMTRTAAAVVLGCRALDPEVTIAGVVLNRVATARQERVIRDAIASSGGPQVLGAIPVLGSELLPGRHLGLVTAVEHQDRDLVLRAAGQVVEEHLDVAQVLRIARAAPSLSLPDRARTRREGPFRVGVFRDQAFSFYYPENLEELETAGAELVDIAAVEGDKLPEVDALYIGGGFPEIHVERLAANRPLADGVKAAAGRGMPVFAECGGLMYLARELVVGGTPYPMAGALDLVVEQTKRPAGHGYVTANVTAANPWFPAGTRLTGHEFHYSRVLGGRDQDAAVLRLERGAGLGESRDGIAKNRIWASYSHFHALGTPAFATSMAALARTYRDERLATDKESPR